MKTFSPGNMELCDGCDEERWCDEGDLRYCALGSPKMDSEVKITIIATGFTSQYGKGAPNVEELRRLMRGGGDTLDVPSFLRRGQRYPTPKLVEAVKGRMEVTPHPSKISWQ